MAVRSEGADICIVGAGVMGTSIAYQLATRKVGRIVICDQGSVGEGMSGRSSALIRMHYTFREEVKLAVLSLRMFRDWVQITGGQPVFHPAPFVRIVHADETGKLRQNVAMQRECGAQVELIDGSTLAEMAPGWAIEDVTVAAYEPNSGYGSGGQVAADLLTRARELGVVYRAGTRVLGLLRSGDQVTGVETSEGPIEASLVICATGVWSKPLLRAAGWDPPIETEFHHVAMVRRPGQEPGDGLACIDSVTRTYFRPDVPGTTLVGSFYGPRGVDPDDFPQRASEAHLAELVQAASRRVPGLAEGGIAGSVTGVYDMTPDTRPLIGPVPALPGCVVVTGFSGMGFKISPAVGLAVAEMVTDGVASSVDLRAFRPERFAEGSPIQPEGEYRDDLNTAR
ncbi:MAG: NAD(P)/FAD-dependent oxidoreductase [Candidatus Dormibacteria bacterium]